MFLTAVSHLLLPLSNFCSITWLWNQSVNQSVNQSINQSINAFPWKSQVAYRSGYWQNLDWNHWSLYLKNHWSLLVFTAYRHLFINKEQTIFNTIGTISSLDYSDTSHPYTSSFPSSSCLSTLNPKNSKLFQNPYINRNVSKLLY